MTVKRPLIPRQRPAPMVGPAPGSGHNRGLLRSMYAITFDMDMTALQTSFHNAPLQNGDNDIGKVLHGFGFGSRQGSVYFGDDDVHTVRCVFAVLELAKTDVWFSPPVRDIRMPRIEDNNDLMPAVASVIP